MKNILRLIICLISLLLCFVAGEFAFRVYHAKKYGIPLQESLRYASHTRRDNEFFCDDKALGWKNIEDKKYGFQLFGDIASKKKKVFILGDSFTRAVQLKADKAFFFYLQQLPLELFVYGADGYSTLQKYLVLKRYFDKVKPDIVIIQLCWNDFVENSPDFGMKSYLNINKVKRPYLLPDGSIVCRDPSCGNFLIYMANHYSKLLRFILSRTHLFSYNIETEISRRGDKHPVFKEASEITDTVFKLIAVRCAGIPVLVFDAEAEQPYYEEFKRLSDKYGFIFMENVTTAVITAEQQGRQVKLRDKAHWNEAGHEIAAKELVKFLKSSDLLRGSVKNKIISTETQKSGDTE